MSVLYDVIERGERVHFPKSLPRFRWYGSPIDPTNGDVDAITAGAVRLLRGDMIQSTTPRGEPVAISMTPDGRTAVDVSGERCTFDNAADALIHAYGEISEFNTAWADFEGRS